MARFAAGVKVAVEPLYETVPATGVVPCFMVKVVAVVAVKVNGSIGTLKVAVTILLRTTPVARSAGSVELTVGAASVLNVNTISAASALPAMSVTPVVIVAV